MNQLTLHESGPDTAPSVVFLHALGISSWMWTDQIEQLSDRFRCVGVDLPGNGESVDVPWTSFADSADQVRDVIIANGGTAHVVGLSLGGYVAISLLERFPEVVDSMVVSGATFEPLMPARVMTPLSVAISRLAKLRLVSEVGARVMQLPDDAKAMLIKDLGRVSTESVRKVYREINQLGVPNLSTEAVGKLLLVSGDDEAKQVMNGHHLLRHQYPTATTAIASEAKHFWNTQYPELFTDMIVAWANDRRVVDNLRSPALGPS